MFSLNFFNYLKDKADINPKNIKPTSPPDADGGIIYNFRCGSFRQSELTLNDDKKLSDIFLSIKSDKLSLDTEVKNFISFLLEANVLEQLLSVLLKPCGDIPSRIPLRIPLQLPSRIPPPALADYGSLTNSDLEKIFNDFFFLNPSLKKVQKIIGKFLDSAKKQ